MTKDRKKARSWVAVVLSISMLILSSASTFASDSPQTASILSETNIICEGKIDPDIYEIVENYENNTFVERNESKSLSPQQVFLTAGISESPEDNVEYIWLLVNQIKHFEN